MPEPSRKREHDQLLHVLNGARVSEDLIKYLTGLGLSSISDFVGLVTTAGFETELKTQVLDLSPAKDDVLQLSRLRAAWREGFLLIEKARKRRLEGVLEDGEEPLDIQTHEDLLAQWKTTYQLQLSIHAMPSDALLGRVYREFQRGAPTLIPAKRMQSLFRGTLPTSKEEVNLSASIKVQLAAEPAPVKSVIADYQALHVLANAYAIAGIHVVDSVSAPGTKVRFAPLDTNLNYCDFALARTAESNCHDTQQLQWLESRDLHTRGKMVEFMRQGVPQGEALTRALRECDVLWTVQQSVVVDVDKTPSASVRTRAELSPPSKRPRRERTVTVLQGNQAICKRHNDQRGCAPKEKDCPDRKRHTCDGRRPDGTACGSTGHTRKDCPFVNA